MMLLRARDNNIQSFAYTYLHKRNQNEFLKHPKIKFHSFNFRMLKEFVLISFMKLGVRKTLNKICSVEFLRFAVVIWFTQNAAEQKILVVFIA